MNRVEKEQSPVREKSNYKVIYLLRTWLCCSTSPALIISAG